MGSESAQKAIRDGLEGKRKKSSLKKSSSSARANNGDWDREGWVCAQEEWPDFDGDPEQVNQRSGEPPGVISDPVEQLAEIRPGRSQDGVDRVPL